MSERFRLIGLLLGALLLTGAVQVPPESASAWEEVGRILGKKGELLADGVYKVNFPRSDLRVMMHDVRVPIGMGLASWAAFMRLPDEKAMVMGDTVMLASEVNPVIDALRKSAIVTHHYDPAEGRIQPSSEVAIEIVALHNHMIGERPQVLFMHYQGVGEPEALARTIRRALDRLGKNQGR